jgi:uncharacterized membrane protein
LTPRSGVASKILGWVGTWRFLCLQALFTLAWIAFNSDQLLFHHHWDPYPYILLNLVFSIESAFTAPLVLMTEQADLSRDKTLLAEIEKLLNAQAPTVAAQSKAGSPTPERKRESSHPKGR